MLLRIDDGTVKVYRLKNLWDGYRVIHGTTLRDVARWAVSKFPDEPLTSVKLACPNAVTVQCLPVVSSCPEWTHNRDALGVFIGGSTGYQLVEVVEDVLKAVFTSQTLLRFL